MSDNTKGRKNSNFIDDLIRTHWQFLTKHQRNYSISDKTKWKHKKNKQIKMHPTDYGNRY